MRSIKWRLGVGAGISSLLYLGLSGFYLHLNHATPFSAVILTTVIGVLLATTLGWYMGQRVTRPISELTARVQNMPQGELKTDFASNANEEVEALAFAIDNMARHLLGLVEASATQHAQVDSILSHLSDGIIVINPEAKIERINPAAAAMFRVNSEEASGKTLIELTRSHELNELIESPPTSSQQGPRFLDLKSRGLFLSASVIALPRTGSRLLLLQNLTELHRLETVRQDFVANLSHELRTPLTSLKALAETLQQGALEDPKAAKKFLGKIDTEVDRLTSLVEELDELTQIESGRPVLNREEHKLGDIIRQVSLRMETLAQRYGLSLTTRIDPSLPSGLFDAKKVEQVLVNLVHNAIKFTPGGGKITILATYEEGNLKVTVADTGIGISRDDMPRIFERFYTADKSRSGGRGLGLAVARHIILAHGGKIWCESEPGRGSRFYFTLPARPNLTWS